MATGGVSTKNAIPAMYFFHIHEQNNARGAEPGLVSPWDLALVSGGRRRSRRGDLRLITGLNLPRSISRQSHPNPRASLDSPTPLCGRRVCVRDMSAFVSARRYGVCTCSGDVCIMRALWA